MTSAESHTVDKNSEKIIVPPRYSRATINYDVGTYTIEHIFEPCSDSFAIVWGNERNLTFGKGYRARHALARSLCGKNCACMGRKIMIDRYCNAVSYVLVSLAAAVHVVPPTPPHKRMLILSIYSFLDWFLSAN